MNLPVQVSKSVTYEKGKMKSEYYSFFVAGTMIDSVPKEEVKELITMLQQAIDDKKEVADGKE